MATGFIRTPFTLFIVDRKRRGGPGRVREKGRKKMEGLLERGRFSLNH